MAHNLSIVNGKAEMFSGNNVVPWHKLGTVVSGLLTAQETIIAAHLDWTVSARPLSCDGIQLPFPDETTSEGWQCIRRDDTGAALGVTKGRYEIIQNKDCFDFLDVLAGEGCLKYETAGALRGGKQIWMLAKYDGTIKIANDDHTQWLLLVSSHDGSYSLMVQWVTVRVVCANTLSIALSTAKNQVKIRHTSTWEDKAGEAKRVLRLTENYFDSMRDQLNSLVDKPVTTEAMQEFSRLLFPAKNESDVPTRTANMREQVNSLFSSGAGNVGKSRWDALQAVTDYVDHVQPTRGENSTKLESALLGAGANLKQTAFEYLSNDKLMSDLLQRSYAATQASTLSHSSDFARLLGN